VVLWVGVGCVGYVNESIDPSKAKFNAFQRTQDGHGHGQLVDGVVEGALALANFIEDLAKDKHEDRHSNARRDATERAQRHLCMVEWMSTRVFIC
jgi:hypothetical protein